MTSDEITYKWLYDNLIAQTSQLSPIFEWLFSFRSYSKRWVEKKSSKQARLWVWIVTVWCVTYTVNYQFWIENKHLIMMRLISRHLVLKSFCSIRRICRQNFIGLFNSTSSNRTRLFTEVSKLTPRLEHAEITCWFWLNRQ